MRITSTCSEPEPHDAMATDLMSVVPMPDDVRMLNVGRDILAELIAEKDCLDANFVHSKRLICEGALYIGQTIELFYPTKQLLKNAKRNKPRRKWMSKEMST